MRINFSWNDPGDLVKALASCLWISMALLYSPEEFNKPNVRIYTWWDAWLIYGFCAVMLIAFWIPRTKDDP